MLQHYLILQLYFFDIPPNIDSKDSRKYKCLFIESDVNDNMQVWQEMSAHCKSSAIWDSFGQSKCILRPFGPFFTERTTVYF